MNLRKMCIDFDKIKMDSRGRWQQVFNSLGIDVGNGKHKPCPNCGGKDRFRFIDENGTGSVFCSGGCLPGGKQSGDGFSLVMAVFDLDFKGACEEVGKVINCDYKPKINNGSFSTPEQLRQLYFDSKPIAKNDLGWVYLKKRGLDFIELENIRFCPKCYEPETKSKMPAILSTFTLPQEKAVTIHRIFLTKDGDKAKIDSPKKIMPVLKGYKMTGGAVRLSPVVGDSLGVAEGIETAVACMNYFKVPTWAALSTSMMENFVPPVGVKTLYVFADNDKNFAGQKAAYTLAHKMAIKRKEVVVYIPERFGTDFLDEYNFSKKRKV